MSGDLRPETDGDSSADAVTRLLGTNTTLGIIAGLTLAAATTHHHSDEADTPDAPTTPIVETAGRSRRKSLIGVLGAGTTSFAASSPAKKPPGSHPAVFSVQAPRETIERLQNQNKLLKQELSIEARAAREMLGQEKRSRVEQLRSTLAAFARKLAKTQRQVERTEQVMARKTQELAALRLALQPIPAHEVAAAIAGEGEAGTPGKPLAAAAAAAAASGKLRTAENRLELALVRKNEVDSANKHLLARVEAARRDRTIFDGIYKKLEREASVSKSRHEQAKADLARATQARDALAREVAQLQDAAEREQFEYEHQFQELKHSIAHWRHETGVRMAASELQNSGAGFGVSELLGGLDASSEQNKAKGGAGTLTRVTALSSWKIGVDRALTSVPDSLVAKYDEAFAAIRERTGLQDASALAHDLLARDAANFQRFKRVEELSREEVALQTQVAVLTSQIEAFKAREGIASRASQKQQCRRVEAALRETQQACDELDAEIEDRDAVLGRIKASVHSVHNTLAHAASGSASGGGTAGNSTVLGQGITDANVVEYLQAIEMYTTELLQSKVSSESSEASPAKTRLPQAQASEDGASPLPVGHGPPTLPSDPRQKLHVHVPSFGGVDGIIELPAQVLPYSSTIPEASSTPSTPNPKRQGGSSVNKQQQQQQQQHRRLSSRGSLSQRQFASALAAANAAQPSICEETAASSTKRVGNDKRSAQHGDASGGAGAEEDEEDERALTYDELKRFAAKNTKSKRRGANTSSKLHH